jgi:hypothetical protein
MSGRSPPSVTHGRAAANSARASALLVVYASSRARQVVDDLTDALETALERSSRLRRSQYMAAHDAATFERSVARAVALLDHAKRGVWRLIATHE